MKHSDDNSGNMMDFSHMEPSSRVRSVRDGTFEKDSNSDSISRDDGPPRSQFSAITASTMFARVLVSSQVQIILNCPH
jgi:hypothetical protein